MFTVKAASGSSWGYAWQFNGIPIPGATNAILSLANLTATQSGSYTVSVSNQAGLTVSAPATLEVVQRVAAKTL
jgi:hypothetical protein